VQAVFFRFVLFFSCSLLFIEGKSQWYDPEKINKKAGDIYAQAYEAAQDGKYR